MHDCVHICIGLMECEMNEWMNEWMFELSLGGRRHFCALYVTSWDELTFWSLMSTLVLVPHR